MVYLLGRVDGKTNFAQAEFIVANGVTVTKGDFVYLTGGYLSSASAATVPLIGCVSETVVGDGTKKALVCVDPQMRYAVDNDNAGGTTFAVTHVGTKFDLVGAGAAQYIDSSSTSATTGQMLCLEYNPQVDPIRDDTSFGSFVIAEHAFYPLGS